MARKAKFSEVQVKMIRNSYKDGVQVKELAVQYDVHAQTIYRVLQGKHPYEFEVVEQGTLVFDAHGNATETAV